MGSCFVSHDFDAADASALKTQFRDYQSELTSEYGHDPYNGTLSNCDLVSVKSTIFNCYNEANEWLCDNTSKRDAIAVRYRVVPDYGKEKKGVELTAKIADLEKRRRELERALKLENLPKGSDPVSVKCGGCKSKLNYPQANRVPDTCPVCREELYLSAANKKKLGKMKTDVDGLRAKYAADEKAFHAKVASTCPTRWMVGGWAPS